MQKLSKAQQELLCTRISTLKRRGLLVDWGYVAPIPNTFCHLCSASSDPETVQPSTGTSSNLSPHDPPTLPIEMSIHEKENVVESNDWVPIVPVLESERTSTPSLVLVPKLTNKEDIVLLMGSADPENDPRHAIDTSPLYCMVHPPILPC